MRNQWRLLFFRSITTTRSPIHTSTLQHLHLQVQNPNPQTSLFSSFLIRNIHHQNQTPFFSNPVNTSIRTLSSSESALEHKDLDQGPLPEILSKSNTFEDLKTELESNDIKISYNMVLETLQGLQEKPEVCRKFFDWVSETNNERLSSKSYNLILSALGRKDYLNQFWDLVKVMKKKGYRESKSMFTKVSDRFEKEGLGNDLEKLKIEYAPDGNTPERVSLRVCKAIRKNEWGEEVQKSLREMNVNWSSEVVARVVEHPSMAPGKSLMFFWWVEEEPEFKHDAVSYNAMLRVLGIEDFVEKFWRVFEEMKGAGCEMEMETYTKVVGRFYKRKMLKDVVDLYEFMVGSANKPGVQDFLFLLRKTLVGREIDMYLFSRVLKIFTDGGNVLTHSMVDLVLKSLTSVGRLQECSKILKAMEESGYVPTKAVYDNVVCRLCAAGRSGEAVQFINLMVSEKQFQPRHTTFKMLIEELARRNMKEAMNLLVLMKDQGFPPFLDPIIDHISKSGSADDAICFMKEMTVKKFPSTPVCIRVLQAFLKAGRHDEAHNCFAKCPDYIRNHADVLNLFCAMKADKDQIAEAVSA